MRRVHVSSGGRFTTGKTEPAQSTYNFVGSRCGEEGRCDDAGKCKLHREKDLVEDLFYGMCAWCGGAEVERR